ncbi:MAG: amino acid permease [Chloroflexi bacterium]|nr:amino acid permease [Chloroflexota bacterium]
MKNVNRLERKLGLWAVSLSGVGVILGAGIYALIGPAAGHAGNGMWASFVIAAAVAGLTALTYARFVRIRPKNSPEFQYATLGFGPRIGFTAGWLMIWADVVSVAAVALGFGGYLTGITPLPIVAGALLLIAFAAALAWWGLGESIALAIVFTLIEVGGLVFIVLVGVPHWGEIDYLATPRGFGGVWTASALVFFAYLGFDELGNLVEEAKEPERTLPRALGIAFFVSAAIYVAVAVSAASAVGWEALAGSNAPLAEVAPGALGDNAHLLLTLVALAATANTVLLLMVAGSRSIHGMADAKALPAWLAGIGARKTPWAATALTAAVAAAFALIGDLERVAQITNAAILLSFAVVNFALIRHLARLTKEKSWRRIASDVLLPGAAGASCLALLPYTGLEGVAWAIGLGAAGLLVGAISSRSPHAENPSVTASSRGPD